MACACRGGWSSPCFPPSQRTLPRRGPARRISERNLTDDGCCYWSLYSQLQLVSLTIVAGVIGIGG